MKQATGRLPACLSPCVVVLLGGVDVAKDQTRPAPAR